MNLATFGNKSLTVDVSVDGLNWEDCCGDEEKTHFYLDDKKNEILESKTIQENPAVSQTSSIFDIDEDDAKKDESTVKTSHLELSDESSDEDIDESLTRTNFMTIANNWSNDQLFE